MAFDFKTSIAERIGYMNIQNQTMPKVITVTSGKGGVGKTNISVNLACCLAKQGKRVILVDADLGLANVDVILGLTPQYTVYDLFRGKDLAEILFDTPYGFKILPASSGVSDMMSLETGQKLELLEAFDEFDETIDYLIVDTGAGIHDTVLYFNLAAQERLVVLTTEPTSLTDAYALIKVLKQRHGVSSFKILVNAASNETMAKEMFTRLYAACDHFLEGVSLDYLGYIPKDTAVRKAIMAQTPFCIGDPNSQAAKALEKISKTVQNWDSPDTVDGNIKFFWKKLLFRG